MHVRSDLIKAVCILKHSLLFILFVLSLYIPAWIVQDVTLFHTVAVFGMTGERASMSNGSLASSRVLNMARSPNAIVYVYVKFSTTVTYRTIQMFEHILREFVQSRPREWSNLASFRATRVVADLGFIGTMTMSSRFCNCVYVLLLFRSC